MATTTFSTRGTVDGRRSTTTHDMVPERGNGATRRGLLRWLGSVAAAGALGVVGASGRSESAQAKRRSKKRHKRHNDRPQPITSSSIETSELAQDQADGDQAFVIGRCKVRVVCYPDGVCHRRRVCR
jgi:hypothetical protein